MKKTILILGGYGGVGKSLSRLLLKETNVEVIISGRRKEKAEKIAAQLNKEFPGDRVTSRYADASNQKSLIKAFQDVQLVIVLSNTPDLIKQIGEAAIVSGCDYLDILVSGSAIRDLGELAATIRQQKRIFITQAGFHPGLPAVFVRCGAHYFETYDRAIIAMAMNARFERAEQTKEIIKLVSEFEAEIFKDGGWKKATYRDAINVEMGNRFGRMKLFPIQMEEIRLVQKMFNLKETGVYVSGFNWFIDYLVVPLIIITQKIRKGLAIGLLQKFFTWGVNKFSSPYQGVAFLNDAEGIKDGKRRNVRIIAEYEDAYLFTAIPIVACLKQYLDRTLPTGLWMMGHVVDENRLLNDMEKMGVKISRKVKDENGGFNSAKKIEENAKSA